MLIQLNHVGAESAVIHIVLCRSSHIWNIVALIPLISLNNMSTIRPISVFTLISQLNSLTLLSARIRPLGVDLEQNTKGNGKWEFHYIANTTTLHNFMLCNSLNVHIYGVHSSYCSRIGLSIDHGIIYF